MYIFEKGIGWGNGCTNQTAKLLAADGAASDHFGFPVSISGDTLLVGAYVDDGGTGSAYIFERDAGWQTGSVNQRAKLTASDRQAGDFFGHGASISGDIVITGAFGDDARTGGAYVFQKPLGGWVNMTETVKLTASGGTANHEFGRVAIFGNTAMVGASAYDDGITTDVGAVYAFSFSSADCPDGYRRKHLNTRPPPPQRCGGCANESQT